MVIAFHCEGCIACHVHDAVGAWATRQELIETIIVDVMMGGGLALMYAAQVQDAVHSSSQRTPAVK